MWQPDKHCQIHPGEYFIHAWLDFLTKLQKFTSLAYSWSTREEYKILDGAVPDELLAVNANAGSY